MPLSLSASTYTVTRSFTRSQGVCGGSSCCQKCRAWLPEGGRGDPDQASCGLRSEPKGQAWRWGRGRCLCPGGWATGVWGESPPMVGSLGWGTPTRQEEHGQGQHRSFHPEGPWGTWRRRRGWLSGGPLACGSPVLPHSLQQGEEKGAEWEKTSGTRRPGLEQGLTLELGSQSHPEQGAGLTSFSQSLSSQPLRGLFMSPARGWAGRQISPAPALLLLTGPGNVELKSSRISSVLGAGQIEWANSKLRGLQGRGQGFSGGGRGVSAGLQVPGVGSGFPALIPSPPWECVGGCHCPLCWQRRGWRDAGTPPPRRPPPPPSCIPGRLLHSPSPSPRPVLPPVRFFSSQQVLQASLQASQTGKPGERGERSVAPRLRFRRPLASKHS